MDVYRRKLFLWTVLGPMKGGQSVGCWLKIFRNVWRRLGIESVQCRAEWSVKCWVSNFECLCWPTWVLVWMSVLAQKNGPASRVQNTPFMDPSLTVESIFVHFRFKCNFPQNFSHLHYNWRGGWEVWAILKIQGRKKNHGIVKSWSNPLLLFFLQMRREEMSGTVIIWPQLHRMSPSSKCVQMCTLKMPLAVL